MRNYVIVWLSGVIAGLVLVERWRRAGADASTGADSAAVATEVLAESPGSARPPEMPKMYALIVTGAKADVRRARHLLNKVAPWGTTSDPPFDEFRHWSPAASSAITATGVEEGHHSTKR